MTAETDLLPVAVSPYTDRILAAVRAQDCTDPLFQILDDYARANLAELQREVEGLRAEVERLQAELDNRWAQGVHTCHDNCQRVACVLRRDNKRLAEALREARHYIDGNRFPGVVAKIDALHPTAAQEGSHE